MDKHDFPFIIAEIGINHNGDIDVAKKLIDMAKNNRCDAVKFQKRTPELCIPEHQKSVMRQTPWGYISYLDYRHKIEFGKREYDIIDEHCRQIGIDWFASSWDIESQMFLRQYNLKHNKVASPMLTNIPLLNVIAEERKHTFISTGMSTYDDIDKAVDIFRKHECPFTLMHCQATYPAKEEDLNLSCIITLRERYGCDVGYSGHETSPMPSIVAAALGAVAIERHITLDRAIYGSDQAASLEARGLYILVANTKKIPRYLGDGIKRISEEEQSIADKLRYFKEYGGNVE